MLADIADLLECPVCREPLALRVTKVSCAHGHEFDVARQGYVNLLPPNAKTGTADTASMIEARDRFLVAGRFSPLTEKIVHVACDALPGSGPAVAVEMGAGTGHYLAALLDALPAFRGVALDVSKYAARRAAKAHPRAGSVIADAWGRWPVNTGVASVVIDVFAPRNAAEMRRVLCPDGILVVAVPTQAHLAELVSPLGLLSIDPSKEQRIDTQMAPAFEPESTHDVEFALTLTRDEAATIAAMGPGAYHSTAEQLAERAQALPPTLVVSASVRVMLYRATPEEGAR